MSDIPITSMKTKAKLKRYRLKSSESRKILENVIRNFPELSALFPKRKVALEVVEFKVKNALQRMFLLEGNPVLVELSDGLVIPYIEAAERVNLKIPRIVVDLGAVPHIAKGADVMGPGIVKVEGKVMEGCIVLVIDERLGRIIAIGRVLRNEDEIKNRGKSVENLHYSGDIFWKILKVLKGDKGSLNV